MSRFIFLLLKSCHYINLLFIWIIFAFLYLNLSKRNREDRLRKENNLCYLNNNLFFFFVGEDYYIKITPGKDYCLGLLG